MYALIESGGQQHKVEPGRYITIKRLAVAEGAPVVFDKVLLVRSDETIEIGTPAVEGAEVHGSVRRHLRGKKVHGYKYKAKKGYSRRWGARADLTQVTISKVVFGEQVWAAELSAEPVAAEEEAEAEVVEETIVDEADEAVIVDEADEADEAGDVEE